MLLDRAFELRHGRIVGRCRAAHPFEECRSAFARMAARILGQGLFHDGVNRPSFALGKLVRKIARSFASDGKLGRSHAINVSA